MAPDEGIEIPDTVDEGGILVIKVHSGAEWITLVLPDGSVELVPVVNNTAEFQLPPSATGGSHILVSDNDKPVPNGGAVLIVSNNQQSATPCD